MQIITKILIVSNATDEELEEIDDIGQIVAKSIKTYLSNPDYQLIINSLKYGIKFEIKSKADNKFKGLTFIITGSLSAYSRNDASEIVESKAEE